jgi:hypothetical protein
MCPVHICASLIVTITITTIAPPDHRIITTRVTII